jgi:ParB family chromosome partitioning protein
MMADIFQQLLGPRPSLTLDIEQGFVTGLWVAGRRPDLIIRDFDLGASAPDASLDVFGAPFVSINWHLPPWRLGLALAPPHLFPF